MSFGFSVVADEKIYGETGERLRLLTEMRLSEVSPVTFPAYVLTEVNLREWPGHTEAREVDGDTIGGAAPMADVPYEVLLRQRQIRLLKA